MTANHPNALVLKRFYDAFTKRDAASMATCYHSQASFSDPVFGHLDRQQVCAMWTMLLSRSKDLTVAASGIEANDSEGRAHWEASYTFSKTQRPVINKVDAHFTFKDGLILNHEDHFSFWNWSSQALGLPGMLLGWTPLIKGKVAAEAKKSLDKFIAEKK